MSSHTLALKKEVNAYLDEIKNTSPIPLFYQEWFILTLQAFSYITLITVISLASSQPSVSSWTSILIIFLYILNGFCLNLITFIFHAASHKELSKTLRYNKTLQYISAYLLGISPQLWKILHVLEHHNFPNFLNKDNDIEYIIRLKKLKRHEYIIFYVSIALIAYMFYFLFYKNLENYNKFKNRKKGSSLLFEVISAIISPFVIFLIIPAYLYGGLTLPLVGFIIMEIVLSFSFSTVSQIAHVGEKQHFSAYQAGQKLDFAVVQLKATANFSTKNKLMTWYTGALNHQIEHHLFPKIHPYYYPKISQVVKTYCSKHSLPYFEYPSYVEGLKGYFRFIRKTTQD